MEERFRQGYKELQGFVTENLVGVGQFWGKFLLHDADALRQASNAVLPMDEGAEPRETPGWEDIDDGSLVGPGAMKNLLWLAPELPKNLALAAVFTVRDAIRKMMTGETDVDGQPNHLAVAYRHCVEEGTAPVDVAQYCLYSTQVQLCETTARGMLMQACRPVF